MFKKLTDHTTFESIEVLRFPLMILVVFVHVISPEPHAVILSWDPDNMFTLFSELISHIIGRVAVPVFFLFSGYFFFLKLNTFNRRIYREQIGKRCRTLLIPYLFWVILYVFLVVLKNVVLARLGVAEDDMYVEIRNGHYYQLLWGGPLLFPFWYIRDLICMVLLTPLFYVLFKYLKAAGLCLLAITYLMVWELNIPGVGTTAFFFFGAGAFMGQHKFDLMALGTNFKGLILVTAIISLGLAADHNATAVFEFWVRPFVISGVVAVLCLGNLLVKTIQLKAYLLTLSSSVFFIYAVHSIYMINWLKGGFAKSSLSAHGWGRLLIYFMIPIVCLLTCLCLYQLIKYFFPKLLALSTGGRMAVKSLKE
jgi:fucose 4-O-acetylase-like acetyltransferase